MDYILEELLRQQEALTELLLGGKPAAGKQAAEENDAAVQTAQERRAAEPASVMANVQRAGEEGDAFVPMGRSLLPAVDGPVESRSAWGQEAARTARPARAKTGVGESYAPAYGTGRGTGETIPMAGTGVRELSRAIERDARRYDGGFTIY